MSFVSLSAELVLGIFLYLPPSTFASLSLCCKRFHQLVEPQLYRSITQTRGSTLQQFLRSLSIKPHRAKYVQHISAKAWDHQTKISTRFLDIDQSGPRVRPHAQIQDLLPRELFGKRHCEEWYQRIFTNRGWDAIVALLFVLCTNLESVSLSLRTDSKYACVERVVKSASVTHRHPPKYLTSLSRVDLNPITGSRNTSLYSTILKLDSIREFNGHGVIHGWASPLDFDEKTPRVFKVAKVTIKNNPVYLGKGEEFTQVLRWFHSMRSFSCEGAMGASCACNYWTIMNGLMNSRHSLEELRLSSLGPRFRDVHTVKTWSPISSFKDYVKLRSVSFPILLNTHGLFVVVEDIHRSLELDSWMFLQVTDLPLSNDHTAPGWLSELLPESLEQLTVRECKISDLDTLIVVFASARSVPERLKTLKVSLASGTASARNSSSATGALSPRVRSTQLLHSLTFVQIVYQLSTQDFEQPNESLWSALEQVTYSHGIVLIREIHIL